MAIIHITDDTFEQEVVQSPVPVLVDFWAEWCAPCRMLGPVIEELEVKYRGKIHVGKIDIDRQPISAVTHKIMSIPTVCMYVHGKEVKRMIGLRDKAELEDMIRSVLEAQ